MTSSYHLEDRDKCNKDTQNSTHNIPKLRFKGYNDEWKKYRLKDIVKIYDGTHQTPNYMKEGIKFVSVENISNLEGTNKYISKADYDKDFKIKPETNDVLMTRIGDIGTPALIDTDQNYAYYVSLALLKSNQELLFPKFFVQRILSEPFQHELWRRTLHVAFPKKINKNEIGECNVFICSKSEQEKIASFLTLIDKNIEKQKELVELLKKYKRGLLSQIFSQKLRFKDEEEPWPKVKLDKLGYFLGGGTPSKNNREYWSGTIPWISSSDISEDDIANINMSRFITQNAIDNSATKICPNDTICIVSRVGVGKLAISKECVCTSQDFVNFINTTNNNTFYIAYSLKEIMKEKVLKTQGTSIKGITSSEIKNIQIALPTIEIQNKVACISSYIDSLINKHENLYKFMLQYKKGLLQQMFI